MKAKELLKLAEEAEAEKAKEERRAKREAAEEALRLDAEVIPEVKKRLVLLAEELRAEARSGNRSARILLGGARTMHDTRAAALCRGVRAAVKKMESEFDIKYEYTGRAHEFDSEGFEMRGSDSSWWEYANFSWPKR